jgi:hypothetical protein
VVAAVAEERWRRVPQQDRVGVRVQDEDRAEAAGRREYRPQRERARKPQTREARPAALARGLGGRGHSRDGYRAADGRAAAEREHRRGQPDAAARQRPVAR